MNAERSFRENVFRSSKNSSSVKKFLRLLQHRGAGDTSIFKRVMTWTGGVLQASVMTWGGVAKPPVMPRGVEVGPHPWDCLRGI